MQDERDGHRHWPKSDRFGSQVFVIDEIVINDCGNLTQAEMSIERLPQLARIRKIC
jgi:hypothetical protein